MVLTSFLEGLYEKLQKLAAGKRMPLVLGALFLLVILINGISNIPSRAYQVFSQKPFGTRTDITWYNTWNEDILLPLIGYFTGMTGRMSFSILCFTILVAAYVLFTLLAVKRYGSFPAFLVTILLLTSVVTTIMLSWLGSPEGITFLLSIPFLFTNSVALIFFLALAGMWNHPAFIIAAGEVLFLRLVSRDEIRIKHIIAIVLGAALGYLSLKYFISAFHIQALSRLEVINKTSLQYWFMINADHFPMTLFSLFNIQWLVFPVCLLMFFKKNRRYYLVLLALLLVNYGVAFFTKDTTRIYSITSWGILFNCIFHSYKLACAAEGGSRKEFLQALMVIGLLSFVSPRFFAWDGAISMTPFYSFNSRIIENLVGIFK